MQHFRNLERKCSLTTGVGIISSLGPTVRGPLQQQCGSDSGLALPPMGRVWCTRGAGLHCESEEQLLENEPRHKELPVPCPAAKNSISKKKGSHGERLKKPGSQKRRCKKDTASLKSACRSSQQNPPGAAHRQRDVHLRGRGVSARPRPATCHGTLAGYETRRESGRPPRSAGTDLAHCTTLSCTFSIWN